MNKPTHVDRIEKEAKEEIKDLIYLIWGKHILDEKAKELLLMYKHQIKTNDNLSIDAFIQNLYESKD